MATIPNKVLVRLTSGIKKFQGILKSAKERDVNESDTAAIVMDILAEVFGYNKYSEITSELDIKKTYCDLAIKIGDDTKFLLEIKAIGIDLKPEHIRQAVNYGSNKGTDWVILTNGDRWCIFKIIFDKPLSYDLIYEFDFLEINSKKISDIEYLYYISKESLGRCALEEFLAERQSLNKFFIGQVLITNPVLECIKKTIRRINPDVKVSTDEIKDVLVLDVIKREVFDDEKSDDAKKKINKVFRTVTKKEPRLKVKPKEETKQTMPPIQSI